MPEDFTINWDDFSIDWGDEDDDDTVQDSNLGDYSYDPNDWSFLGEDFDPWMAEIASYEINQIDPNAFLEEGEAPFDPWAEIAGLGPDNTFGYAGEWEHELDLDVSNYWDEITSSDIWTGDAEGMMIEGGWGGSEDLFTPWGDWEQGEIDDLESQAMDDTQTAVDLWNLTQDRSYESYIFKKGASEDLLEHIIATEEANFEANKNSYIDQITFLANTWALDQASFERQRQEAAAMWGEEGFETLTLEQKMDAVESLYALQADDLNRQEIAAQDLWQMNTDQLDALGIQEGEIWALERASIESQKAEATGAWGLKEAEYVRQAGVAGDIWNVKAADIARQRVESADMWKLEEKAMQDSWDSEQKMMGFAAQTQIREAQKSTQQQILRSGFSTSKRGISNLETNLRRNHGIQLNAGDRDLTNKLQIGIQKLTNINAALTSELNMNVIQLEDTLASLGAAKDASEAEYNSQIRVLSDKIGIGEMDLANKLAGYDFDKKQADFTLDQTLAGLEAAGWIDEAKTDMAVDDIQASIDRGAIGLQTILDGINAEEQAGLLLYQNNIENQVELISRGETDLETAITSGLLTYRQAVGAGLIDYENAIELGATEFEISIGNIYDDMIDDMDLVMNNWADENADILANILADGTYVAVPEGVDLTGEGYYDTEGLVEGEDYFGGDRGGEGEEWEPRTRP